MSERSRPQRRSHLTAPSRTPVPAYSATLSAPFATALSHTHDRVQTMGFTSTLDKQSEQVTSVARASYNKQSTVLNKALPAVKHVTSAQFEQQILDSRSNTIHSEDMREYHSGNEHFASAAESEAKAWNLRKIKRVQHQNAELRMQYDLEEKERESLRATLQHQQDQQLAAAIEQEEKERVAEQVERIRVCEKSDEIRDLKEKLKMASINRDRHMQLLDKQRTREEEQEADVGFERHFAEQRAREEAKLAEEKEKSQSRNSKHAQVLSAQMDEKVQAKVAAYQQFMEEKAAVERVVVQLAAEDERKAEHKRKQQTDLQASISTYLRDRALWRNQERKKAEAELQRIMTYQAEQDRRAQERLAKTQAKTAREDEIYAAISKELERVEKEREDMERMLEDLYEEEREQAIMREIEAQQAKETQMRKDMMRENDAALVLKAKQQEEAKVEQAQLRSKLLVKLEEDRAFEILSDAKRRAAKLKLRSEMEASEKVKKEILERQQAQEDAERLREQMCKQREIDIIAGERERLLNELATSLQDYLPRVVLTTQR